MHLLKSLCGTCVTTFTVCCVPDLIAAQLVFVVGVERTENEVKSVCPLIDHPLSCTLQAVCSAIAVLLHYLFYMVVFKWMLMEGNGLVRSTGQSVYQIPQALHCCFHCS